MRTPCNNGSFGLYVETGFAAAGVAALDIISFGCREPLKWALGRGQIKDFFGTRSRGITNPISHKAPKGTGKTHGPRISAGPSFFWAFEGLFERTLYMLLLAEVGKDFFLNWTSMLMAANGCEGAPAGYCEFQISPQIVGPGPGDMLIASLPDCHGVISDTRAWYVPQGLTCSVGYHAESSPWVPAQQPNATLTTYIKTDTGDGAYGGSVQGNAGTGSNGVTGFHKGIPGATAGYARMSIVAQSSGFSWVPKGKIQVTLSGHEVKIFSPPDCFKKLTETAFDKWLTHQFE